jgi:signal transduction histidine kinase
MKIKTALQAGTLCTIALAIIVSISLAVVSLHGGIGSPRWTGVFALTAFLGILSLVMANLLYRLGVSLARRIARLERELHGVSSGRLDEIKPIQGHDEVTDISRVMSEMAQGIQEYVRLIPEHDQLKIDFQKLSEAVDLLRHRNMDVSDSLQRLRRAQGQFAQHERLSMLGQLFESASSDVDSSVQSIVKLAEQALSSTAITPETRGNYEAIAEAARRTSNRLTNLSVLAPRPGQDLAQTCDLRDAVREALALTEPRWKTSRPAGAPIAIEQDFPQPLPVTGRPADFVRLFIHLIVNAVEAMPRGGTITARGSISAAGRISVTVTDNGIGMSANTLNRCLKAFFSTKDGKAGIGLALVQSIVLQHRGRIGIESQSGTGTTVFLEFPSSSEPPTAVPASAEPVRRLRILVAEDDAWTRDILTGHLKQGGHIVEVAENGTRALQKLQANGCDLVITDRAMPDMSGDELAKEVKKFNPILPVILLTGYGTLMKERGETPEGVDLVLGKPVCAEELSGAVNELGSTAA